MKHLVVTIGCEYGAGGPQIGKMLSEALGFEYYDRDLVDDVVRKLGVDKELVEKEIEATKSRVHCLELRIEHLSGKRVREK